MSTENPSIAASSLDSPGTPPSPSSALSTDSGLASAGSTPRLRRRRHFLVERVRVTPSRGVLVFEPGTGGGHLGQMMADFLNKSFKAKRRGRRPPRQVRSKLRAACYDAADPGHPGVSARRQIFPSRAFSSDTSEDSDRDDDVLLASSSSSDDGFALDSVTDDSDETDVVPAGTAAPRHVEQPDSPSLITTFFLNLTCISIKELLRLICLIFVFGGIYVANQTPTYGAPEGSLMFPSVTASAIIPNRFGSSDQKLDYTGRLIPRYVLGPLGRRTQKKPNPFVKVGRTSAPTRPRGSTSGVKEEIGVTRLPGVETSTENVLGGEDEATSNPGRTNGTETVEGLEVSMKALIGVAVVILMLVIAYLAYLVYLHYCEAATVPNLPVPVAPAAPPAYADINSMRCGSGFHYDRAHGKPVILDKVMSMHGDKRLCNNCYNQAIEVLVAEYITVHDLRLLNHCQRLVAHYMKIFAAPPLATSDRLLVAHTLVGAREYFLALVQIYRDERDARFHAEGLRLGGLGSAVLWPIPPMDCARHNNSSINQGSSATPVVTGGSTGQDISSVPVVHSGSGSTLYMAGGASAATSDTSITMDGLLSQDGATSTHTPHANTKFGFASLAASLYSKLGFDQ